MSVLKIYKGCKITRNKNAVVENISDYLLTLESTALTVENFKYIKHAKNIEIKVDTRTFGENVNIEEVLNFKTSNNYNYVSINNIEATSNNIVDNRNVFYFIINKEWTSEYTVRLILEMDVLNTFEVESDYVFNKKTNVLREHRDRIYNSYIQENEGRKLYRRKIDKISEGLTPILYKKDENLINDTRINIDWYLMYKTDNNIKQIATTSGDTTTYTDVNTRLKAFLLPAEDVLINSYLEKGFYAVLGYNFAQENKAYVFGLEIPGTMNTGTVDIFFNGVSHIYPMERFLGFESYYVNETLYYRFFRIKEIGSSGGLLTYGKETIIEEIPFDEHSPSYIKFQNSGKIWQVEQFTEITFRTFQSDVYKELEKIKTATISITNPSTPQTPETAHGIKTIDRSDPTIYKIIKIPYAAIQFEIGYGGNIDLPTYAELSAITWAEQESKKYINIKENYYDYLLNIIENDVKIYSDFFTEIKIEEDERNDDNESKLYNSSFYNKKFTYDSFAYILKNETLSKETIALKTPSDKLSLYFIMSSSMNSRFLFDFPEFASNGQAVEDYEHLIVVQRNNELPIFNDAYLNYIRNGYNYDVKTKERQKKQTVLSTGAQLVGAIASFAAAPITGGLSASAGISLLTSSLLGISNAINTTAQAEANINQKLAQLENQGISVAGSDDVDLMSYYTGNRLKLMTYGVSDNLKKHLADLFYYCGYASDEQKTPNIHTRKWFNFLQADAIIENQKNIPQEIIENLVDKYKNGVIIYHKNVINSQNTWDFEQVKANNEVWLYE